MGKVAIVQSHDDWTDVLARIDSFAVGDEIIVKGEVYSYAVKIYYRLLRISREKIAEKVAVFGAFGVAALGPIGWAGAAAVGGLSATFLYSNYEKKVETMQPEEMLRLYNANFRVTQNSRGELTFKKMDLQGLEDFLAQDWKNIYKSLQMTLQRFRDR